MPLRDIQLQENDNLRQSVLLNLNSYSESLVSNSSSARTFVQNRNSASKDLNSLERNNVKFVNLPATKVTGYYSTIAAFVAIYGLDVLLFGGVATKFAQKAFPDNEIMLYVIKFVSPLLILFLEFLLALKISQPKEQSTKIGTQKRRFSLWTFLGLVFALVMPLFIVSSDPDTVNVLNSDDSLATLLSVRLCGLLIVAFLAHGIVIFSGSFSSDTKAFLFFRYQRRKLANLITSLDEIIENYRQLVINAYNSYTLELATYNQQFPNNQIPRFEFDHITQQFIEEAFTGNTNTTLGSNENSAQTTPENTPEFTEPDTATVFDNSINNNVSANETNANNAQDDANQVDGENEYLRSVLTRNIKDSEDEVN